MSTEADARMLIDKLLEAAGWAITNKAQVSTEEASSDGRADYLLKDCRTRPPRNRPAITHNLLARHSSF
jgi:predicted type IV restriction endonuclease